jgi:hypothetical protein
LDQRVTQQDVTINGQQYRVTKMDARSACWLFAVISNNVPEDKPILSSLGKLSLDEFSRVQTQALRYAYTLDSKDGNVFPTSVLAADGSWADKALEASPTAIYELTVAAVLFNLNPFITVRESSSPAPTV